jgi:hypothetical protein
MPREPEQLADAIWNGEFGFICEDRYHDIYFQPSASLQHKNFDQYLADTKKLPDLAGASVASWFLARVARLAGRRFPFSYGQVIGSDGASYWLRFFCISKPATPIGSLSCLGSTQGIYLKLALLKPLDGTPVLDAFKEALLQKPSEVGRCRVIVQWTDMVDPAIAIHIPKVYGWDGQKYLNEGAPEHALDPSEYE